MLNLQVYDWVFSLEVAEHIPKEYEDTYLVRDRNQYLVIKLRSILRAESVIYFLLFPLFVLHNFSVPFVCFTLHAISCLFSFNTFLISFNTSRSNIICRSFTESKFRILSVRIFVQIFVHFASLDLRKKDSAHFF